MTIVERTGTRSFAGGSGECQELLWALAAHGLPASAWDIPDVPDSPVAWADVLDSVAKAGLLGLMADAVGTGSLRLNHAQRCQLEHRNRDAQARTVLLERAVLKVSGSLGRHGIQTAVAGGLAAGHHDYAETCLRPVEDACLLVRSSDFDEALRHLQHNSWDRIGTEPAPGFDRRFGMGVRLQDAGSVSLELIRTLAPPPYSLALAADSLWEHVAGWRLGGSDVGIPDPSLRLFHACYSAVFGSAVRRPLLFRDAAAALYRIDEPLEVVDLARSWRTAGLLAWAISEARRHLRIEESLRLIAWAECYEPSGWERRAIAAIRDPRVGYAARALSGLSLLQGVGDKVAFARMTLFPDRSYRSGRTGRRAKQALRLVRPRYGQERGREGY